MQSQAVFPVVITTILTLILPLRTAETAAKYLQNTASSYAVASALSPQYSGVSGYATQKYNNDSNKNYLSIVSRDTLLSMWSDVLN